MLKHLLLEFSRSSFQTFKVLIVTVSPCEVSNMESCVNTAWGTCLISHPHTVFLLVSETFRPISIISNLSQASQSTLTSLDSGKPLPLQIADFSSYKDKGKCLPEPQVPWEVPICGSVLTQCAWHPPVASKQHVKFQQLKFNKKTKQFTLESSCCMYDHRYSILAPKGWTWRNVDMMPERKRQRQTL